MTLLSLLMWLVIIGVALYFLPKIPMDAALLQIIRAVCIIAAVILVLVALGVFDALSGVSINLFHRR